MKIKFYEILSGGKAIKCLICKRISLNHNDVRHKYCGNCCKYLENDHLGREFRVLEN